MQLKLPLWLLSLFNKALAAFKSFFNAVFPIATQIVVGALKDVALQSVLRLRDADTMTNEQKREAAFKEIKEYAQLKGLDARDALINLVIEMAVLKMKGEADVDL